MQDILAGAQTPSAALAMQMLRQHPTCVLPAAMCLRHGAPDADAEQRQAMVHAVAMGGADRIAMSDLADLSGQDWASIYPQVDAPKQKSTKDAIDVFIETYGHSSAEDDALLEKLIFNPVAPDYFQGVDEPYDPADPLALPPELMAKDEAAALAIPPKPLSKPEEKPKHMPEVDSPGQSASSANKQEGTPQPVVVNKASDEPSVPHEEPSLMESLAKIYIKQHRYARALEIINNLSLKYPEKSVYFADQIRFLRKLVNNQRRWQASGPGFDPSEAETKN